MSKHLIFIVLLSFGYSASSQTGIDLGLKKKKNFISVKKLDLKERERIEDYFILDNDTLVNLNDELTTAELKLFCECYTNDTIVKDYKTAVFHSSRSRSKYLKSNHWNSKIKVYFDSDIPKKTRRKLIKFYEPLNNISNLNIDFVKNKDKSNYIIKTSDTLISNFKDRESEYKETHPLKRIYYNIATDKSKKFYSGIATIDLLHLEDKSLLLQKLKQLFFITLGQFAVNESFPETSLLSTNYNNSDTISKADLNILKMHYFKIFDEPVSAYDIDGLIEKSKNHCNGY